MSFLDFDFLRNSIATCSELVSMYIRELEWPGDECRIRTDFLKEVIQSPGSSQVFEIRFTRDLW